MCSVTQLCLTLCDSMDPARLLCQWDFPGKNTELGCLFLLHWIFPTQGSNWCLLSHLHSHWESPCLGSSQPQMWWFTWNNKKPGYYSFTSLAFPSRRGLRVYLFILPFFFFFPLLLLSAQSKMEILLASRSIFLW